MAGLSTNAYAIEKKTRPDWNKVISEENMPFLNLNTFLEATVAEGENNLYLKKIREEGVKSLDIEEEKSKRIGEFTKVIKKLLDIVRDPENPKQEKQFNNEMAKLFKKYQVRNRSLYTYEKLLDEKLFEEALKKAKKEEEKTRPNWNELIETWIGDEPKKLKDFFRRATHVADMEYYNLIVEHFKENSALPFENNNDDVREERKLDVVTQFEDLFSVLERKMGNDEDLKNASNLRELKEFGKEEVVLRDDFNKAMEELCKKYAIPCDEYTYKDIYGKEQDGGKKKVRKTKKAKKGRKTKQAKKTRKTRKTHKKTRGRK